MLRLFVACLLLPVTAFGKPDVPDMSDSQVDVSVNKIEYPLGTLKIWLAVTPKKPISIWTVECFGFDDAGVIVGSGAAGLVNRAVGKTYYTDMIFLPVQKGSLIKTLRCQ